MSVPRVTNDLSKANELCMEVYIGNTVVLIHNDKGRKVSSL